MDVQCVVLSRHVCLASLAVNEWAAHVRVSMPAQRSATCRYNARVVTIDSVKRRVEIKYDGWGKKYNKWFNDDSTEVRAPARQELSLL